MCAATHLRQRRLGLGQPERHLHGMVEVDGRCQFHAGLLPLACLGIQGAETVVAVRLEGAHTQFFGQGEGLLVVGFSLRDIKGVGMGMDSAKLVQRVRLVPAFLELPSQVERLTCVLSNFSKVR